MDDAIPEWRHFKDKKKKKTYWKTKTKGGMKRPAVFSPVTSVAVRDFLEHCRERVLKTETEQ